MYQLKAPKPDDNTAQVTVLQFFAKVGDEITENMDICSAVADKGEFTVWAEQSGTLLALHAAEGDELPVGYILASIGERGDDITASEDFNRELLASTREELVANLSGDVRTSERIRATPTARRLARKLNIDLAALAASMGGKLVKEGDVRKMAEGGRE